MNDDMIDKKAREVFDMVAARATDDDMRRLRDAFSLAREAHASQFRKGGGTLIFSTQLLWPPLWPEPSASMSILS